MKRIALWILCLLMTTAFGGRAETIVALTSGKRLLFVDSATPGTVIKTLAITGLPSGERLYGIDFRARTGILYALGQTSIYLINTDTGSAAAILANAVFALPSGTRFGMDFNPTDPLPDPLSDGDTIRVTTDADKNVRFNPDTLSLSSVDNDLHYAPSDANAGANPNVVSSAYTNSFSGARATVLYDIDSNLDILAIQDPPRSGDLHTVGRLGVDTADTVGFDISGSTGVAYASLSVAGTTSLYTINLVSGAATLVGPIADASKLGSESIVDIAAMVPPSSKLLNISTRGRVGRDQDGLIAGFITRAGERSRYLLRALGPSLTAAGIAAPLADPVLSLYDKNGEKIIVNDNWRDLQEGDIAATGLAPSNNAESAILLSLRPGSYTAVVYGKGSDAGVALVEVYQLP